MKKLINFLVILTLFLDNFILFEKPFNFYFYYIIFLFFLFYYISIGKKIAINRVFIIIIITIVFISLIKTVLIQYSAAPVIKQLISITFSSLVYYLFLRYNNFNTILIFITYLQIVFWVSVVGIVQQLLFISGIQAANPVYSYKLCSIMSEPAHFAIITSPAFFVAVNRGLDGSVNLITKTRSFIIILAYMLTFSGVALLGVICSGILIGKKYLTLTKKHLLIVPAVSLIVYVFLIFAYRIPDIQMRVDDTWAVLTARESQQGTKTVNVSTFAIFSNYLVAKEAFFRNPLFGTGLGTHSASYDLYINHLFPKNNASIEYQTNLALNREDANSLLIRLASETGLFGIGIFLTYLIKRMLDFKSNRGDNYIFWLINNSILVFFVLRLIRFGNYSALGFFLFVFVYYLTYKQAKRVISLTGAK